MIIFGRNLGKGLLVSSLLAVGSTAQAADHLMKINEVFLDDGSGGQYVELIDPSNESFPNTPYALTFYNNVGVETGSTALEQNDLANMADEPILVANQAWQDNSGNSADVLLDTDIPAVGSVCFENATRNINCISWGGPTLTPELDIKDGEAPGVDESLQRDGSGNLVLACPPTPDAPNVATACTDSSDASVDSGSADAGTEPDASSNEMDGSVQEDASAQDDASLTLPDASDPIDNDGSGDDDGGCSVSAQPRTTSIAWLAFGVALIVRRKRR